MKRNVYAPPLPPTDPATEARQKRRQSNGSRYKRRADMTPDELAKVRASNLERQKAYLRRKRAAAGLPAVGKPGRPRKSAA